MRHAQLSLNSSARAQLCVDPIGGVGRQGEGGTDPSFPPSACPDMQGFPSPYRRHCAAPDSGKLAFTPRHGKLKKHELDLIRQHGCGCLLAVCLVTLLQGFAPLELSSHRDRCAFYITLNACQ